MNVLLIGCNEGRSCGILYITAIFLLFLKKGTFKLLPPVFFNFNSTQNLFQPIIHTWDSCANF